MALNLIKISTDEVISTVSDMPDSVLLPDIGTARGFGALVDGWVDASGTYKLQTYVPPPPLPPTITERRQEVVSAIDGKKQALLDAGAPYSGKFIQLDNESRSNLSGMGATALAVMVTSGAVPWPASYAEGWISADNSRIALATPADGLALAAAAGDYYGKIAQNARSLKDTALASGNPESIDITAGWPS